MHPIGGKQQAVASLTDSLTELVTASAWTYVLIAAVCALDAVLPIVPSETVVLTAAVLAADGRLPVELVALAAGVGSFCGDNASYALGRWVGGPIVGRLTRGGRAHRLSEWARAQLRQRGVSVIVGARFVPGGRTATTLSAGGLGMPWRRFGPADALAATLWALYTTALGYVGGTTFRDRTWLAIAVSFGLALVLGVVAELIRRATAARGPSGAAG